MPTQRSARPLARARRWVVHHWRSLAFIWKEFRWSLTFTAIALVTAAVVLHEWYPVSPGQEPIDWSRAAYFALVMLTFEPALEFHSHAPWFVKALFFGFPVLGLVVILDSLSRFTKIVLQRRNNKREWFEAMAKVYRGHHLVCGLGRVGYGMICELDRDDRTCVAVELAENEYVARAFAMNVPVIVGNVLHSEVLDKAGLKQAASLAAVTGNDLVNIDIALAAYTINPRLDITVRLDNAQLGALFQARFHAMYGEQLERNKATLKVINTNATSAHVFADAARVRNEGALLPLGGDAYTMVDLDITKASRYRGKSLAELQAEHGLTVALHHADSTYGTLDWRPDAGRRLEPGDTVVVFGRHRHLEALQPDEVQRPVVICGLGTLGAAIVEDFRQTGTPFVLVDRQEDHPMRAQGCPVVIGDACQSQVLTQAGIETAAAVIAVTPDPLVNLEIGLFAQSLNPDIRVVLRIDDEDMARMIKEFFALEAISPLARAAATFADASRRREEAESFHVGGQVIMCHSLTIASNSKLDGDTLKGLRRRFPHLSVVCHSAGGSGQGETCELVTVTSERTLKAGATLVAIGTSDELARLVTHNMEPRSTGPLPPLNERSLGRSVADA